MNYTDIEISKLQDSLQIIRHAAGWSLDEFGDKIGVTKQTISNLENKKTKLSKTQYIAIRTVLDYEISYLGKEQLLGPIVNLCLDNDNITPEERKRAQAFVVGSKSAGLDSKSIIAGLRSLLGSFVVAKESETSSFSSDSMPIRLWLSNLMLPQCNNDRNNSYNSIGA